jgi:glycosyltransferase involved in cell wall biosynthesis
MKKILLINRGELPHYRVPVYNYLSDYLKKNNYFMTVVSENMEDGQPHSVRFPYRKSQLGFTYLLRLLTREKTDIAIFWTNPSINMAAVLFLAKLLKIKIIHWGHRRPQPPYEFIKYLICNCEHWIDDAVILYADHLKKYVFKCFQEKTFVANNTLNLSSYKSICVTKEAVKRKHGISTKRNIICMGRMQRRKRIDDLVQAFCLLKMEDVGLILAGPDSEGILKRIEGRNIFKTGAVYGDHSIELLSMSDVCCIPGAIGLSIVDAFYCGLPVVTEDVTHGPEIMYLKDGVNGFITAKGDIVQLAAKLKTLLMDDALRERFSQAAKIEIMTNGNIDRMCEGFRNAIEYVCNKK